MTSAPLQVASTSANKDVWQVGYLPQPWAWPSWQYFTDGRFPGRWDDAGGPFRTIYAGSQLLSCLLEMLARFRPDPKLAAELADIVFDTEDESTTTIRPAWSHAPGCSLGQPPRRSDGNTYAAITEAQSVAALRPIFLQQAQQLGLEDPDAATLKDARPRSLTQHVATYISTTASTIPASSSRTSVAHVAARAPKAKAGSAPGPHWPHRVRR